MERIPFSETRNYVQRVIKGMLVYRHRLGSSNASIRPKRDSLVPPRPSSVGTGARTTARLPLIGLKLLSASEAVAVAQRRLCVRASLATAIWARSKLQKLTGR